LDSKRSEEVRVCVCARARKKRRRTSCIVSSRDRRPPPPEIVVDPPVEEMSQGSMGTASRRTRVSLTAATPHLAKDRNRASPLPAAIQPLESYQTRDRAEPFRSWFQTRPQCAAGCLPFGDHRETCSQDPSGAAENEKTNDGPSKGRKESQCIAPRTLPSDAPGTRPATSSILTGMYRLPLTHFPFAR
jgi:hypothetical protein